ncbi:MAG: hypothetical protein LW697_14150 [Blastopirellula sp.]|nr:hypothetical protein [Blastopirellula sp.]
MKVLLNEVELAAGVRNMATDICSVYGDRPLTIVGILTGSVVLMADLIRLLDMPLRVGVVQTSSYRGSFAAKERTAGGELSPRFRRLRNPRRIRGRLRAGLQ